MRDLISYVNYYSSAVLIDNGHTESSKLC